MRSNFLELFCVITLLAFVSLCGISDFTVTTTSAKLNLFDVAADSFIWSAIGCPEVSCPYVYYKVDGVSQNTIGFEAGSATPAAPAGSATPAAPAGSATPAAPAGSATPAAPAGSATPAAPAGSAAPAVSTFKYTLSLPTALPNLYLNYRALFDLYSFSVDGSSTSANKSNLSKIILMSPAVGPDFNTSTDSSILVSSGYKSSKFGFSGFSASNLDKLGDIYDFLTSITVKSSDLLKYDFSLQCQIYRTSCSTSSESSVNFVDSLTNSLKSLWYAEEESNDKCGLDSPDLTEETLFYGKPMKIVHAFNVPDRISLNVEKHYWKCDNHISGCSPSGTKSPMIKINDKLDSFTTNFVLNNPDLSFGLSRVEILELAKGCSFKVTSPTFGSGSVEIEKIFGNSFYYHLDVAEGVDIPLNVKDTLFQHFISTGSSSKYVKNLLFNRPALTSAAKLVYGVNTDSRSDYYYTIVKVDYTTPRNFGPSSYQDLNKNNDFSYEQPGFGEWYFVFSKSNKTPNPIDNKDRVLLDGTSNHLCYVRVPLGQCTKNFPRVIDIDRLGYLIKRKNYMGESGAQVFDKTVYSGISEEDVSAIATAGVSLPLASPKRVYINPTMVFNELYARFYSQASSLHSIPLSEYSLKVVGYGDKTCTVCGDFLDGIRYVSTVYGLDKTGDIYINSAKFLRNSPVNGFIEPGFYDVNIIPSPDKATNFNYLYNGTRFYPATPSLTMNLYIEPSNFFYQGIANSNLSIIENFSLKQPATPFDKLYASSYATPLVLLIGGVFPIPSGSADVSLSAFTDSNSYAVELRNNIFQYIVGISSVRQDEQFLFTLRLQKDTIPQSDKTKLATKTTALDVFKNLDDTKFLHYNDENMLFMYDTAGTSRVNVYSNHDKLSISGIRYRPIFSDNSNVCKKVSSINFKAGSAGETSVNPLYLIKDVPVSFSSTSGSAVSDYVLMYNVSSVSVVAGSWSSFITLPWKKT